MDPVSASRKIIAQCILTSEDKYKFFKDQTRTKEGKWFLQMKRINVDGGEVYSYHVVKNDFSYFQHLKDIERKVFHILIEYSPGKFVVVVMMKSYQSDIMTASGVFPIVGFWFDNEKISVCQLFFSVAELQKMKNPVKERVRIQTRNPDIVIEKSTIYVCSHCNETESGMIRCNNCEMAYYCNTTCQNSDRVLHRETCSIRKCNYCEETPSELMRCSVCRITNYCNKKCQARDWKEHKLICKTQA